MTPNTHSAPDPPGTPFFLWDSLVAFKFGGSAVGVLARVLVFVVFVLLVLWLVGVAF